jgi:hypothetical protein
LVQLKEAPPSAAPEPLMLDERMPSSLCEKENSSNSGKSEEEKWSFKIFTGEKII